MLSLFQRNLLLQLHELSPALLFYFLRDLVFHGRCRSVILPGIRKDAQTVKFRCVHKFQQFPVILLRLSGKSGNQGCPQGDIRNFPAQGADDIFKIFSGCPPPHAFQNPVAGMLDRQIQVMADLRLLLHGLNQFRINLLGITVQDPDPAQPRNPAQLPKEQVQRFFPVKIPSVHRGFLRYQDQFFYPLVSHVPGFFQQFLHGDAAVAAPQPGNDAVGTVLVASLRDLQVSVPASRGEHPPASRPGNPFQRLQNQ